MDNLNLYGNQNIIPQMVFGTKVIVNDQRKGLWIRKTFKQRFLSWPWKPWIAKYFDPSKGEPLIEDGKVLGYRNDFMCMNQVTFNNLNSAIINQKPQA